MQNGRSGQLQMVVSTPRDANFTAWYADAVRHRQLVARLSRRGHGHRAGAGAARPGLPRSTLMDPHLHVVGTPAYDEFDVDAVRESICGRPGRLVAQVPRLVQVVDEGDRVRIAHVDVDRGPLVTVGLDHDSGRTGQRRLAHVDGERAVVVLGDLLDTGAGADADGLVVDQPGVREVLHEDADAVPAHFRDRTVRIPVVHEPVATVLDVRLLVALDHPQYAVGAEAGVAVAEEPHQVRVQVAVEGTVRVGQDDEVVLRAVPLQPGKAAHERSVRGGPPLLGNHPPSWHRRLSGRSAVRFRRGLWVVDVRAVPCGHDRLLLGA